jgi:hypothetical protein
MHAATCQAHLYLLASVAEDTLKKVQPHSVATALASMVLPVPGGPNSITPCSVHVLLFNDMADQGGSLELC